MRSSRQILLLLAISAATFLVGLGGPAITDADEAYYAEASREMVETRDWLSPRYNYRDRWEKPVLYYWLTAATYTVAGPTEWAARLWSALAGIGLTFLTWTIARRTQERADHAWLAAAIVATSFGYFAEARMALPDLPLAFFVTLSIWAAMRASLDGAGTASWIVAGAAMGLGFLMKGPVAVAVPLVVLIPVWWLEPRPLGALARGIAIAGVVAAAIGLPWYVAMWSEHGTPYLRSFFIGDNLERFTTGRFNARRPPGYYVAVLLGGMLPWSAYLAVLAAAALPRVHAIWRGLPALDRRLVIWSAAPLLFFTISVGQQPRYILPVLPPMTVLLARAIAGRIAEANAGWPVRTLRIATVATALLCLAVAAMLVRARPVLISVDPAMLWIAVAAIVAAGMSIAAVAALGAWRRLPATLTAAAVTLLLGVQFGLLDGRRPAPVEQMAALVARHRQAGEAVGAYETFVRNLVFYTRVKQVELGVEPEAAGFLQTPNRVLLVIDAATRDRIQAVSGVPLRTLASVRYLNTANIKIGMLLSPDPAEHVRTVLLVTNQ